MPIFIKKVPKNIPVNEFLAKQKEMLAAMETDPMFMHICKATGVPGAAAQLKASLKAMIEKTEGKLKE